MAGVLSTGFMDRLSHGRLVLVELLEGPLEVGVGVGGAGHEASGGVNPQDVISASEPHPNQSAGY